jgi:hypothetical protein
MSGIPYQYIDKKTDSLKTIEFEHHAIHAGITFHCHYEHSVSGDNEMVVIAFNTPDTTKLIHITAAAAVTNQSRLSIIEAPSIDVDEGTQLTIYNRNRSNSKTSVVSSIENPPVVNKVTSYDDLQSAGANITTTDTLDSVVVGVSGGASPVSMGIGALTRAGSEWVLNKNTQYAFMVQNLSAHANVITLELNWYEITPK